jgi:hypothetical protein
MAHTATDEDAEDVYDDRVLGAPDVCNNCFQLVRVERVDPTRGGITRKMEAHYERVRKNTVVDYGPADTVSGQKGVFCDCGVEGSRERIWSDADVDRERIKAFIQALATTLRRKGLSPNVSVLAGYAIQAHKDGLTTDAALRAGVSAALRSREQTGQDRSTA